MKNLLLAASAASLMTLAAAPTFAQTVQTQTTVETTKPSTGAGVGIVGGAATGAALGGPVGAVIGGVVGGIAGAAVDPPAEVRTYITTQKVAAATYDGQIVIGQPLAGEVRVYTVPKYERYRWTFVNGRRVLIDEHTRNVVAIID